MKKDSEMRKYSPPLLQFFLLPNTGNGIIVSVWYFIYSNTYSVSIPGFIRMYFSDIQFRLLANTDHSTLKDLLFFGLLFWY